MSVPQNVFPPPLSIGRPLVSIIMPCLNAVPFLEECIRSVLAQSWEHWELLFVDNGSTDGSPDLAARFTDPRIHLLKEAQLGVSKARNKGLSRMRGQYFCFLDADDILPKDSIRLRLDLFRRYPDAHCADGAMQALDSWTRRVKWTRSPWFNGMPFDQLMRLDGSAFSGNTWLVKRLPDQTYQLPEHMDHSEDNAFYLGICRQGRYVSTPRVVLHYRVGHPSANSDPLRGHQGYLDLFQWMRKLTPPPTQAQLDRAWQRLRRFMFRDLVKRGHFISALRTGLRAKPQ